MYYKHFNEDSHKDSTHGVCLTFSEIATGVKQDTCSSWRQAPVHEWFEGNHPGAALLWTSSRRIETIFARLHRGHTIAQRDEAHFWLNGYVKKQNCRIWSEANPQVYVETPLHPEKRTVWCALWAGRILLQKR
ncbi:hypothetical protein TNCV_1323761 [Trichonephila clavipes]|nr:hypothetical protein TNCV_1323761 [Trichonephila clavipes]